MTKFEYDKDFPFAAYITNLGKYNEGELVGEWVKFPVSDEELENVKKRIGIGEEDESGCAYEEWFITDYDCYVPNLYSKLGEYSSIEELNELAELLVDMEEYEYNTLQAVLEADILSSSSSLEEIKEVAEDVKRGDKYYLHPDIQDADDWGRYLIEEYDMEDIPDRLKDYFNYEAYGQDDIDYADGRYLTDYGLLEVVG